MRERHGDSDQASAHSTGDNNLVVGRVNTLSQIFYERATFAMGWAFLVLAAALAGYAVANWPGGSRKQYVGFFAFLLLAAVAAVCHIGVRKPDSGHSGGVGPHARRQEFRKGARPRLPDLLLIAALVFSLLSWWSFENVVRNGEVTATFDVHGSRPLTGAPGSVLTMKLVKPDRADLRDRLRLTLRIGEDDPDAPACSHKTRVDLTAVTAGSPRTRPTSPPAPRPTSPSVISPAGPARSSRSGCAPTRAAPCVWWAGRASCTTTDGARLKGSET